MKTRIPYFHLFVFLLICSCIKITTSDEKLIDSIEYYCDLYNKNPKNEYLNRISDLTTDIKNESLKLDKYNLLANYFYNRNSINRFHKISKKILSESIKLNDTNNIAKGFTNLGDYYLKRNINDSAFYYLDKAEKFYKLKNNLIEEGKIRLRKAKIQYYENDFQGCELSVLKVIRQFEDSKNYKQLNICYTILGLSNLELNEYNKAIENLTKSLEYSRLLATNSGFVEIAYNNLGLAYLRKKNYLKALSFFRKVKNDKTKKINLLTYYNACQNFAYCNFKLGNNINFENEYKSVIGFTERYNLSSIIPKNQFSEYFKSINNLESAQKYALDAYETSINERAFRERLLALKQLLDVFPDKAKFYSDEYVKLKDSIADVDKKTSNTFARIEYRVDELNSEKDNLEQKNKNFILYGFVFILVLALAILGYMVYESKKKLIMSRKIQQANEDLFNLMNVQQEEIEKIKMKERNRIAKELHDGIMNKLTAIRFNLFPLQNNPTPEIIQKSLTYIDSLHEVEQELRDLSHELNELNIIKDESFGSLIQSIYQPQENSKTGIMFNIEQTINWNAIQTAIKLNLYRIVQETISNVLKHANATMIWIFIKENDNQLFVTIEDNGSGFEPENQPGGIGLKNCRERAEEVKGKWSIFSKLNNGTKINLIIPIVKNHE